MQDPRTSGKFVYRSSAANLPSGGGLDIHRPAGWRGAGKDATARTPGHSPGGAGPAGTVTRATSVTYPARNAPHSTRAGAARQPGIDPSEPQGIKAQHAESPRAQPATSRPTPSQGPPKFRTVVSMGDTGRAPPNGHGPGPQGGAGGRGVGGTSRPVSTAPPAPAPAPGGPWTGQTPGVVAVFTAHGGTSQHLYSGGQSVPPPGAPPATPRHTPAPATPTAATTVSSLPSQSAAAAAAATGESSQQSVCGGSVDSSSTSPPHLCSRPSTHTHAHTAAHTASRDSRIPLAPPPPPSVTSTAAATPQRAAPGTPTAPHTTHTDPVPTQSPPTPSFRWPSDVPAADTSSTMRGDADQTTFAITSVTSHGVPASMTSHGAPASMTSHPASPPASRASRPLRYLPPPPASWADDHILPAPAAPTSLSRRHSGGLAWTAQPAHPAQSAQSAQSIVFGEDDIYANGYAEPPATAPPPPPLPAAPSNGYTAPVAHYEAHHAGVLTPPTDTHSDAGDSEASGYSSSSGYHSNDHFQVGGPSPQHSQHFQERSFFIDEHANIARDNLEIQRTQSGTNLDGTKSDAVHPFIEGRRDVFNPAALKELRIVSKRGTIRGFKNRVKAGIEAFLEKDDTPKINYRQLEAGRVVLYMTSVMVVRGTFERCMRVKKILNNHMVQYEERDIFLSRENQRELMERLGEERIDVPQVFADGQILGTTEEIEALNESGELRKIFKNFTRVTKPTSCEHCGGYRFLPCSSCHGSKKSLHRNNFTEEFSALRCIVCDENGLVRCEVCSTESTS